MLFPSLAALIRVRNSMIRRSSIRKMVHSRRHRQSWGMCTPRHIERRNPNDVVKGGLWLPTSDVAKALFESVFKCQARKFGQDRALYVLRNSIKACPQNIHRYSRMGHSDFGLFVKSDGSCGMKRDGIPNNLHLLRRDAASLQERARRIGA